jgi:hypothetical protein
MGSLDNQKVKRKISGFEAGLYSGLIVLAGIGLVNTGKILINKLTEAEDRQIKSELNKFMGILDTEAPYGVLDEKEVQRFYDEMQINPQTEPFSQLSMNRVESFLDMYEGK